MARSWLLRLTLISLVVLLLLVSIDSVEGAKKKEKASTTQDADVAAAPKDTGAYRGSGATSTTTPTTPPPTDAAAQKAEQRKAELARKRADKEASRRAAALKQAKLRANQLALRRAQKTSRDSKARATLRQRAEDLAQKKRKADTPEMRRKGHEKLQTLLKRTAESSTRMISFDTTQYHRYVSEGPRPYFLMLVYTALSAQHNCHYCHVANQALIPVAQAHYERNQQQIALVLSSNTTADLADSQLPVFFVNVDMGRNPELFKELKFNQAPYMVLAPPRLGTKTLKPLDFIRTLPQKYRFNLQASMSAGDFQGFVNKLAGCHVQLDAAKPGFLDLLFSLVVLFALAFVGFKYGYDILMKLRELRGVRFLALAAGLGLYCWCIAGGMYNIIRGTQFSGQESDGSSKYIMGDPRDQYAAEGLIIGVLNVAAAVAVIFMNTRSFSTDAPTVKGAKLSPLQHLYNAIAPFFTPGVCLVAFLALWFQVISIYSRKNWGYRHGFVWRT